MRGLLGAAHNVLKSIDMDIIMCISPAEIQYDMFHQSSLFISYGLHPEYTLPHPLALFEGVLFEGVKQ